MVAKPLNHDGNSDTENNNYGTRKDAEGKAPVVTNQWRITKLSRVVTNSTKTLSPSNNK